MKSPGPNVLIDMMAALSHDLRSSLSGASLTAGLMGMHADEEIRELSERLNRMVSAQTTLLDLAHDVARLYEHKASGATNGLEFDAPVKELAEVLREVDVAVVNDEVSGEFQVSGGRVAIAALKILLAGGDAAFDVTEGQLVIRTTVQLPGGEARSVPLVALALCGVSHVSRDGMSSFAMDVYDPRRP